MDEYLQSIAEPVINNDRKTAHLVMNCADMFQITKIFLSYQGLELYS